MDLARSETRQSVMEVALNKCVFFRMAMTGFAMAPNMDKMNQLNPSSDGYFLNVDGLSKMIPDGFGAHRNPTVCNGNGFE